MDRPIQAQTAPRADAPPESLFEPGRNCCAVARAARAALVIDGENYFHAFMEAAMRARRSIIIVGWDFNSRTRLRRDEDKQGPPAVLGDFLNFLARRNRRLRIHILDWDFPMVFGADREFPLLYGAAWKPHRRVHLYYDNTHPTIGSHHQKIVVIDDKLAFSGGLDLTCRRWDCRDHRADDPRRVTGGEPYAPFHDVMMAVDGEAARVLSGIVRDRWKCATGKKIAPVAVSEDPWPPGLRPELVDVDVAVSRTVPLSDARPEVREVEALYLDMVAKAKRSIYIENQYFTSHRIGAALAARLEEPDGPEVVVVSRLLSHGWLEEHTMHVLRTRLVKLLRAADKAGRFHIYYSHVPGLADGTCLDVHSKVMVVDDEWLRVGSANLCNRSMGMDTECDLTVEARGREDVARAARDFRNDLLGEHLGVEPSRVKQEIERAGTIHGGIEALRSEGRSLRPLEGLPEWSDAVISLAEITDPERPVSMDQLILEFSPDTDVQKAGFAWGKALMIAGVCLGLAAMWRYTPLAGLVSAERIIGWAEDFAGRPWAPFALMAAYTPASFTMFPRPLITLFAVVAFGPWLGLGYALPGILLAAASNYYVGRLMNRATVRRIAGNRLNRISEVLRRRGLIAMTAVRLVPIAPFAVVGLVAGAIRVRMHHFIAGTFLGMLPGALATTVFGDQLTAVLRDPGLINYWLIAGVVVVFAIGIFAVRRWFHSQFNLHPHAAVAAAHGPRAS
ncbi:MAG TPA: VTT domain-containing protein [Burkholderiales bacterium]|nr:VTT domain-containing protein [Burkholderiales bacterium]